MTEFTVADQITESMPGGLAANAAWHFAHRYLPGAVRRIGSNMGFPAGSDFQGPAGRDQLDSLIWLRDEAKSSLRPRLVEEACENPCPSFFSTRWFRRQLVRVGLTKEEASSAVRRAYYRCASVVDTLTKVRCCVFKAQYGFFAYYDEILRSQTVYFASPNGAAQERQLHKLMEISDLSREPEYDYRAIARAKSVVKQMRTNPKPQGSKAFHDRTIGILKVTGWEDDALRRVAVTAYRETHRSIAALLHAESESNETYPEQHFAELVVKIFRDELLSAIEDRMARK
ncbi:MAG: hypothetical protein AAGD32_04705 [Planctomycetota bacterium]